VAVSFLPGLDGSDNRPQHEGGFVVAPRRPYYVYIMTNKWNRVFYTGVTGDLLRRAHQHRTESSVGFTARYRAHKLVYFETFEDPLAAIAREKQIKGGSRRSKVELIQRFNPTWRDLFEELS
jgi:putative endonuclease